MNVVQGVEELISLRNGYYANGASIGFVPTMGALHEGHLSLIRRAKKENRFVFVSIFVNPAQFGPKEDYAQYPRVLEKDMKLLEKLDIDTLFTPKAEEIYPTPPKLKIDIPSLSSRLCGAHRVGHFSGVLLVVLKLLNIIRPHKSYFGKKDYQQCILIQRMTEELLLETQIVPCEIVREASGLAMSSRNSYLTNDEAEQAACIYKILQQAQKAFQEEGVNNPDTLKSLCEELFRKVGITKTDYIEVCDKISLLTPEVVTDACILLVAVYVGQTRLIDNIEL